MVYTECQEPQDIRFSYGRAFMKSYGQTEKIFCLNCSILNEKYLVGRCVRNEPRCEKTGFLQMRNQRRRSASR